MDLHKVPVADDDGEGASRWSQASCQAVSDCVSLPSGAARWHIDRDDVNVSFWAFQPEDGRPAWRYLDPVTDRSVRVRVEVLEERRCGRDANASCMLCLVGPPDGGAGHRESILVVLAAVLCVSCIARKSCFWRSFQHYFHLALRLALWVAISA